MIWTSEVHNPLGINLKKQTNILISRLPQDSRYANALKKVSTRSELLETLSRLLAVPGLTNAVATAFRPLLLDLCARWLHTDEYRDERLEAFCLLLEIHTELYPILSAFLRRSGNENGPLAFVSECESVASIDAHTLHRLLLAYYRILQANRALPNTLLWSLSPLAKLIWAPHPDNGVRFLAIRCYALQSGMMEGERVKMEREVIGDVGEVDCHISFGTSMDGSRIIIDGWVMPAIEVQRVVDARNAHLEPQDYFSSENGDSYEPIHPAELSPFIVNIHGVLMFRSSVPLSHQVDLIDTPTAVHSLRILAVHHSLRLPTLLTSAPSSGKSLLLSHLATTLYPEVRNKIISIHLADTSIDPRSLLGSYVSSPTRPGTFEWKDGVLVRAMREGKWVVFEDIDRATTEVLGIIKPLVESLGSDKWIGGRAVLSVPSRGTVEAEDSFAIYATRSLTPSKDGKFAKPAFYGAHKFREMIVPSLSAQDLRMIVDAKFPSLSGAAAQGLIRLWEAVKALGPAASTRNVGLRELENLCVRVQSLLPSSYQPMDVDVTSEQSTVLLSTIFPNPSMREDIYLEARDVFFGAGATTASARLHMDAIAAVVAEHLDLTSERRDWLLQGRTPDFELEKDVNGRIVTVRAGRTRLRARTSRLDISPPVSRPFAMHRPAVQLLSRITTAVSLNEPVLLTGETGTGKTSVVSHLAALLRRPLISLNLSNQTEASDLIGGFKPVDARVPGSELQERFLELFGGSFSRKKNTKFEQSVRKAVQDGKWKRAVGLWRESAKLARERIRAKNAQDVDQEPIRSYEAPRKRRKLEDLKVSEADWDAFEQDLQVFEIQHVQGKNKFAFAFVEGPLIKALRSGDWILLDEVNLAGPETLECISALLHGPTASITLTEQGSLEPVLRHSDFRLFACMNPATDVGKRDLPPNIRSRFTEIDVPPPDVDKDTLLSIITQYIGASAVGDKGAIMDVAEFYTAVKQLADAREIADGSNHKPHYSMRTLARALTFAADMANTYSLRRALWEGCLMTFTMVLDGPSSIVVTSLAQKHLLAGVRNPRSLLSKEPVPPRPSEAFIKFGPFYLERGPLPVDLVDDYIMTPSVETKLIDLARIVAAKRFPVLIEGPTSSGKTSSIEYLAKRTGHRFIRINNHEHTDIQEYLGTYVADAVTGKLVFKDGLLVRALRDGDWIVLDELNLAPTDVLEALNRLLDDNRELVIPETQEIVRPHPHFMLFATQNPPGLYAGRKVLSRAFRNRFLEVHFEDVPQGELETILCERCRIAPSYAQRIVSVFRELQKRRQSSRVFESKHGFATLRDLFRWAGRDAMSYNELAANGYMLLAERTRREDDKVIVKEVLESVMKVRIDEKTLYDLQYSSVDFSSFLGCPIPSTSQLVWTTAMQRLFVLLARALRFNEPVLLVGETGCGKTSVCQMYAETISKTLRTLNCHQNTETADLIGGLRPLRNRTTLEAETLREAEDILTRLEIPNVGTDVPALLATVDGLLKSDTLGLSLMNALRDVQRKLLRLSAIFEWYDGPLVEAMRHGDVFLLDEISLADDSVLERLNSVLEPGRTIVLAERGGYNIESSSIRAVDSFKLVATMNPGGDYGKKELSPALRNRFTEIWVPPITDRRDFQSIIDSLWRNPSLRIHTSPILDFIEWLSVQVGDRSVLNVRDILAWVNFTNVAYFNDQATMDPNEVFHHAARMTYLDGLGSMSQFAAYSRDALERLRSQALEKLQELAPIPEGHRDHASTTTCDAPFSIPRGPKESSQHTFNLQAPTTRDNILRVVRACQLSKPILLEGSPGVGKTSLVTALANIYGYNLCRINLSDQTDLADLFGSDLPIEGGGIGQFAWKEAEFLRALQEGHWVLLDEMNLAPQAILEGLNAVLDHRGTVYVPELGRSFTRHPSFRIFAAQNPLHQGGGRKGLPKSFLNRFTKVYVEELTPHDLLLVCRTLFPECSVDLLRGMIDYVVRLNDEVMAKHAFGREGAPWEFNLRDVIRWGTLLQRAGPSSRPARYLSTLFLERFRNGPDRDRARSLFHTIFPYAPEEDTPRPSISLSYAQIGHCFLHRGGRFFGCRSGRILQSHLAALDSVGTCVMNGWLAILTGSRDSGKTSLVRLLAGLSGRKLQEVWINNATDAADILGSFEEVDISHRVTQTLQRAVSLLDEISVSAWGSRIHAIVDYNDAKKGLFRNSLISAQIDDLKTLITLLVGLQDMPKSWNLRREILMKESKSLSATGAHSGRLEWVDGPLVRALKEGHWLMLDGANLCNPSVLDRLNSLCETDGLLTLTERGQVDGQVQVIKPHPEFRLFMCVDPQFGELSRAMRNRGVEIALLSNPTLEDQRRFIDHLRLPVAFDRSFASIEDSQLVYGFLRRGILQRQMDSETSGHECPTGRLRGEDSAAAWLVDLVPSLHPSSSLSRLDHRAVTFFTANATVPTYTHYLRRFIAAQDPLALSNHVKSISSIVHILPESHLYQVIFQLREAFSRLLAVPLEFLSAQPIDFSVLTLPTVSLPSSLETNKTNEQIILHAIRLFVAVKLDYEDDKTRLIEGGIVSGLDIKRSVGYSENARGEGEVKSLLAIIRTTSESLLESFDLTTRETDISLMLRLLAYGRYLRKAITHKLFNHSAVQVVSRWILDALRARHHSFIQVESHAKVLHDTMSLTSGLGLAELWASLADSYVPGERLLNVNRLERVAHTLKASNDSFNQRSQILQLMALWSLPASGNGERDLTRLTEEVERKLPDARDIENGQSVYEVDPVVLPIQLRCLQIVSETQNSESLEACIGALRDLLAFGCRDVNTPLSHFVRYQHLLWALDAKKPKIQSVITIYMQWLEAVWQTPVIAGMKGPSILFSPMELYGIILECQSQNKSLSMLSSHEATLLRRAELLSTDLTNNKTTRIMQITAMLLQAIAMVSSCFSDSPHDKDWQNLHALWSETYNMSCMSVQDVIAVLEHKTNSVFAHAFQSQLLPALQTLRVSHQSVLAGDLGRCWVALCRFILDLYVPDRPVDPAAMRRYARDFWDEERETVSVQMQLHMKYELRTSGRTANASTHYLSSMLRESEDYKAEEFTRLCPPRDDIARLHSYWAEVSQFLAQAVSLSKVDSVIESMKSRDDHAFKREEVIQESLSAFCQRLNTIYPDFVDISGPIQFALLCMKLGLRLIADEVTRSDNATSSHAGIVAALVAFPSVKSAQLLRHEDLASQASSCALTSFLANLAGIALETALGVDVQTHLRQIEIVYEQCFGLWLIDRARSEETEHEAQSLYRHRSMEHEATEAELEEQDFLSIFPQFEDLLEQETPSPNSSDQRTPALIETGRIAELCELHISLFARESGCLSPVDVSAILLDVRRFLVSTILDTAVGSMPEYLDHDSRAFQIALLHDRLSCIRKGPRTKGKPYNFYQDDNVPEIRKALESLNALRSRLDVLIREWPDQMVLQHLKTRCDTIINLSISSPVPKILSALEQLLLHIEDWEMYANRDNSLKAHQQSLTGLIVEWRRLELASWQDLLRTQARTFADGASDWWFRLYEATVRGVIVAAEEEDQEYPQALLNYLDKLVPLLDEYIALSPIGQYQARLRLLSSFETYIEYLVIDKPCPLVSALGRVRRILRFTRKYYDQFTGRISGALASQQNELEKEIRGFIKLASWKDINVHALKQSAQRTHRQLYKSIRKFRDVLRQPIVDFLKPVFEEVAESSSTTERPYTVTPVIELSFNVHPGVSNMPPHLVRLERTYKTFSALVNGRLGLCIEMVSPSKLDDFAVEIITTSRALANSPVPPSLTAAQREKFHKSLLVRKRKAWSDLLKELKRMGLAANMKPEVLNQQRDLRLIREQPVLPSSIACPTATEKAEQYLYRLTALFPELRASLSDHHENLSTRELQRGIMLLESGFAMALSNRRSLVEAITIHAELQYLIARLHVLVSSKVVAFGFEVVAYATVAKDNMHKLVNALEELIQHVRDYKIEHSVVSIPQEVMDDMQLYLDLSKQHSIDLTGIMTRIKSTRFPILVEDEHVSFTQAMVLTSKIVDALRRWSDSGTPLSYFIDPLRSWLDGHERPEFPKANFEDTPDSTHLLIDSLLVNVQAILSLLPAEAGVESPDTEDQFIRNDNRLMLHLTRALQLDTVLQQSEVAFKEVVTCGEELSKGRLSRFLPFLDRYMELVGKQLLKQGEWAKALLKLDYITCSVMRTVALEGFCRPLEAEDSGSAQEGTEQTGGAGLGEGVGNENVSKEIEDESQVEGLQGEKEMNDGEQAEKAEKDNAVEMSEDFGGEMQDVSDDEHEEEEQKDEGSEMDPEEQLGDLDALDPSTVDEKLWGDESGPQESDKGGGKTDQDHTDGKQDSEVVGNENQDGRNSSKEQSDKVEDEKALNQDGDEDYEEPAEDDNGVEDEGHDGPPVDEYIPDANTLDLPDDMDLDIGKDTQDQEVDADDDISLDDIEESRGSPGPREDEDASYTVEEDLDGQGQENNDAGQEVKEDTIPSDVTMNKDGAVAQPDLHVLNNSDNGVSGGGATSGTQKLADANNTAQDDVVDTQSSSQTEHDSQSQESVDQPRPSEAVQNQADGPGEKSNGSGSGRTQRGQAPAETVSPQPYSNPLRNLGDTLRELIQHVNEIHDGESSLDQPMTSRPEDPSSSQLEYLHPDDAESDMQALGPALGEESAKLRELKFLIDDSQPAEPIAHAESENRSREHRNRPSTLLPHAEPSSQTLGDDIERALTQTEVRSQLPHQPPDLDRYAVTSTMETTSSLSEEGASRRVEVALREWQAEGQPSSYAGDLWRLYESLTQDLSYALCEQLRLILEPTLATRLKGDYRTGKRLNMKKIIPYIASEFTKDKIWLRRTKPSQREYQVLISLDDSRSMAESHSVHLAYETLALVSKALSRLEVGDIAIAKFGESVEILHGFDNGPFTDQAGMKIMEAFRFDQKATQVLSLVETSLQLLEQARERRSMGSASSSDLWQLQIIISDGICQDHERLRSVLRKAEEQRVMIVFIILDSLHTKNSTDTQESSQNSILSMNQVAYKTVDGRMDLQVQRYLDTFPFEYYLVLRDVEALPDVLSSTLKQFFERIAEE
ncbi:hypothetical protein AcW2_007206 [Taiwanofungus camphoratus]|nr:hypothetical protein AcW2_007206 [Antrodia cinnamomea]